MTVDVMSKSLAFGSCHLSVTGRTLADVVFHVLPRYSVGQL